jgi:hypothetical protein
MPPSKGLTRRDRPVGSFAERVARADHDVAEARGVVHVLELRVHDLVGAMGHERRGSEHGGARAEAIGNVELEELLVPSPLTVVPGNQPPALEVHLRPQHGVCGGAARPELVLLRVPEGKIHAQCAAAERAILAAGHHHAARGVAAFRRRGQAGGQRAGGEDEDEARLADHFLKS